MTLEEAQEVFRALVSEGVDFVVIGAMAMAAKDRADAARIRDAFDLEDS